MRVDWDLIGILCAIVVLILVMAAIGLLVWNEGRWSKQEDDPNLSWDAFWVLQVSVPRGAIHTYSRYTKEQCEDARRAVEDYDSVCIPMPLVNATEKKAP